MLKPRPHVRIAVSGDDIVVFDIVADRYLALPGAVVSEGHAVSIAGCQVPMHAGAVASLVEAGYLEHVAPNPGQAIAVPSAALGRGFRQAESTVTLSDLIDLIIAGVVAIWLMTRGRPCRRYVENRSMLTCAADQAIVRQLLARFDILRLIVPTPRRCLPSALLTSLWLQRKGIATEIVFGVRTHPFEAHCWTEHAGIVLDDELDRIRSFVPIAVGLP